MFCLACDKKMRNIKQDLDYNDWNINIIKNVGKREIYGIDYIKKH